MILCVVTGFPTASSNKIKAALNYNKEIDVLIVPSRNKGVLYNENYLCQVENAVVGYVGKRCLVAPPDRIVVLNVEDSQVLKLKRKFFLWSQFVEIPTPSCGCDFRFNVDFAKIAIEEALSEIKIIKPLSEKGPLFLPPKNFKCDGEEFVNLLEQFALGQIEVLDMAQFVKKQKYTSDKLPKAIRRGKCDYYFTDVRGLAYPPCKPSEAHGRSQCGDGAVLFLAGLYRFGFKMSEGFHHDVQFPISKKLAGTKFQCSLKGEIVASSNNSHANIYPNDLVRMGSK